MWLLNRFYPRKTTRGIVVMHTSNRKVPVDQPELRGPFSTRADAWRAIQKFVDQPRASAAHRTSEHCR